MGTSERASNKVQDLKGRAKQATGRATANKALERKGKTDQVKAAAKAVGQQVKEAGEKAKRVARQ